MIVEELVSVLGLEIGANALATLDKFRSTVSAGLSGLATLGGVAAAAFVGVVASVAHAGDEIVNTSEKLGIATDVLQELKFAADQSDVSFESLTTGLKFLSKNAAEAAKGNKEAMEVFSGISLRKSGGGLKTADELLMDLIADFENVKDPIEQSRLAMKRFGRSGLDLVPMLKQGPAGIRAFIKDAHELGVVLGEDVLQASDKFDRQLKRLRDSLLGLRNGLGGPFVGDFADAMEWAADTIKNARPFIKGMADAIRDAGKRFKDTVVTIFNFGKAISEAFGDTFLGKLLKGVDYVDSFEAAIIGMGVALTTVAVSAAASWALALAPFILLGALIGFIVDDIQTFIDGGDSLIGTVQKWAEVMNPDDSPILRFFKAAIALVMDFTDPKRWAVFKDAAIKAVDDIVENIRLKLGGKKAGVQRDARGYIAGSTTEDDDGSPAQGGILGQGGLLDQLGFQRNKNLPIVPQGGPSGIHLQPFSGGAAGANFTPGPGSKRSLVIQQTNQINVPGANLTQEEVSDAIRRGINQSTQDALVSVPRN